MKIYFLGHQSWLISEKNTHILIDPILQDQFGSRFNTGFQVYPPRDIESINLPPLSGVIISHEHTDHFDLASLNLLSRTIPIYIGVLVITPVAEAIEKLGFKVYRVPQLDTYSINFEDLEVTLFPSDQETAFWEKRVYQIYIQSKDNPEAPFFIAVDALISSAFRAKVLNQEIPYPTTIAVSNNSQITPTGVVGSLENIKLPQNQNPNKNGLVGLQVLYSLLCAYFDDLPLSKNILICGGGFMKDSDNFGPFPFSDQDELGRIASALTLNHYVLGMLPGEMFDNDNNQIGTPATWLKLNNQRMEELKKQRENFIQNGRKLIKKSVLPDFKNDIEKEDNIHIVISELNSMIPAMMTWKLGKKITSLTHYQGKLLGRKRFLIRFLNGPKNLPLQFAFDFLQVQFFFDETEEDKLFIEFPFGIEMYFRDFIGIISGEIQIWDIAGIALESWYEGSEFESPVAFFYSYYGENGSPHLAQKIYNQKLISLGIVL